MPNRRNISSRVPTRAVLILAALAVGAFGRAHAETKAGQGVFTSDQSKRGKAVYMANCAQCHQPDLSGHDPIPGLAGDTFMSHWANHSVADLFRRVSTTMPQGKPGSLSSPQYVDAIAFLLESNGLPAGPVELKPDPAALQGIEIAVRH